MTGLALVSGVYMRSWLTDGNHIVVTAHASTNNLRMVNPICGNRRPVPREHVMTGITQIGRWHMIRRLAAGLNTIMTTDTVARDISVINRGG